MSADDFRGPSEDIPIASECLRVSVSGSECQDLRVIVRRAILLWSQEKHLVDQTPDEHLEREAYSEGVRQLLWKYQRLTPGFKVVDRSPTYAEDYASTRYCLAPLGVGWGVRLLWAIEAGCIPVLFSSQVAAWFEDAVDYGSFALHGLPKTALRTLPAVLEAVSPEKRAALQASLWRHRHLFLWRGGGFAYNMTLHELCWRARRRRAKVHCAALLPAEIASLVIPAAARTSGVGGREPRRARLSGP